MDSVSSQYESYRVEEPPKFISPQTELQEIAKDEINTLNNFPGVKEDFKKRILDK